MVSISVIIVTWNSEHHIGDCLDAVLAQDAGAEVIVIDNHSSDRTVEILKVYVPRVRAILNDSNRGFAHATNQGLAGARGQYLLLLNPDAVVLPGALGAMSAFLDEHPETGALGPQLLNPDGSIQPSCREFPRPVHCLYEFTGLSALFPRDRRFGSWRMGSFDHTSQREVDQPMGACLLVRKKVADAIGLLDADGFPMFFNEVDWCYRFKRAGWKIVFFPGAQARHHHGASTRQSRRAMTGSSHLSFARYLLKHHRNDAGTYPAIALIMLALPVRLAFQSLAAIIAAIRRARTAGASSGGGR